MSDPRTDPTSDPVRPRRHWWDRYPAGVLILLIWFIGIPVLLIVVLAVIAVIASWV